MPARQGSTSTTTPSQQDGSTTLREAPRARGLGRRAARRRDRRRRLRRAQPRHRCRGDDRLAVPDRLDHEGLDGDRRHAARRRGGRRAGRAASSLHLPISRWPTRGGRSGDDPPSADAFERHRRRQLRRHRPRRRCASTSMSRPARRSGRCIRSGRRCRTATPVYTLLGRVSRSSPDEVWDTALRTRLIEPMS